MLNPLRWLRHKLAFPLAAIGQSLSSESTGVEGALDFSAGDRSVENPARWLSRCRKYASWVARGANYVEIQAGLRR